MTSSAPIVLCYHAVSPSWDCSLAVTPEQLEKQLTLLKRRGWTATTFTEAVLDPPTRRTLAVTFDDAFASVLQFAFPVLSQLGIPATVFAPTAFMHTADPLSWPGIDHWLKTPQRGELTSMSWDELGTLVENGWEVGSHTSSHPHLTEISDEELAEELAGSRAACNENLSRDCVSIAYPYGDVDERVAVQTKAAGYRVGAGLGRSLKWIDEFRAPRIGIYHVDADWRFRLKMSPVTRHLRAR